MRGFIEPNSGFFVAPRVLTPPLALSGFVGVGVEDPLGVGEVVGVGVEV